MARLIASDLNSGDKAKEDVKNLEGLLKVVEHESSLKDSIILELTKKTDIQNVIISTSNEKVDILKKNYDFVCQELKTERSKSKIRKIVSTGLIAVLTTILILK